MAKGDIPKGMFVLHKCDNPQCVNPDHLELGTHSKNIRDAFLRGRMSQKGERNGCAKLSQRDVAVIRAVYPKLTMQNLANKFGVTIGNIHAIIHQRSWN
jgi:hypothetical protein